MKKILYKVIGAAFIAVILAANLAVCGSFSASAKVTYSEDSSYQATKRLGAIADVRKLKNVVTSATYNCTKQIDISAFKIPYTYQNHHSLAVFLSKEIPQNFHFQEFQLVVTNDIIVGIRPSYIYTASQYQKMLSQIKTVETEILKDIKGNKHLNDVEKALLIHDRLALKCDYDFTYSPSNANMYSALVNGIAVCEGYTKAYDYLLDAVGIDSYYCGSEKLYHAWNIVIINKKPYHVDVTWDDYSWRIGDRGVVGKVCHENFLRSSKGLYASKHEANDYDTFATDTTYDNYAWRTSKTAFQLVNNKLYYIDNVSEKLKCLDDNKTLCSVADKWFMSETKYWLNNACLTVGNGELYYSLSKAVYKYDFATKPSSVVYKPTLKNYNAIYGLEYIDGKFVCDINNTSPYSETKTTKAYLIKQAYKPQTAKSVKLAATTYTYDGKVKTPTVTVKNASGKTLKKGTDYLVTYASGRKNVGTYKVTVKMIGQYTGVKTLTFKIAPYKINKCKVTLPSTKIHYDGKVKSPSVTVKTAGGKTLKKGTDYTVTYASGRKNAGNYKATVKMKGNYSGSKTLTFTINPPKTTVSKLTAGKKSIGVAITKKSTQLSGYQIQYSTSKSFTKATVKTLSGSKTTAYTIKSLAANKTYYVRVRTYKVVGSKKIYSDWSAVKSVKTK